MKIRTYVMAGLFATVATWAMTPEHSAAAANELSVVPAVAEAAPAMSMTTQQPAAEVGANTAHAAESPKKCTAGPSATVNESVEPSHGAELSSQPLASTPAAAEECCPYPGWWGCWINNICWDVNYPCC